MKTNLKNIGYCPQRSIVYAKGEIFNLKELGLSSISDPHILDCYAQFGIKWFEKIRGSFAIAIAVDNKTILVRDQFGEVPLYYNVGDDGRVKCGDSVRGLLLNDVDRKLDRNGLFCYMAFGCLYSPLTMVEGIKAVPAGYAVIVEGKAVRVCRYWTPKFELKEWSCSNLQMSIERELLRAIGEQTQDSPAALLSGGIDSSAIVALWRKQYDGEIRTYCLSHEDVDTDESRWAKLVAERNGTKHTNMVLDGCTMRKWIDEAVAGYDQPSFDGMNFWFATRFAREYGEKTILSGEGGDELFVGYWEFKKHRLAYRYAPFLRRFPRFIGRAINAVAPNEQVRKIGMLAGYKGDPYYLPRRVFNDWQIGRLLKKSLWTDDLMVESIGLTKYEPLPSDIINRISWLEMQTVVADSWMRDGYQTACSNGVSIRTPICDSKIAEILYTVPGSMKCEPGLSKPLLVRAAGSGYPDECARRPKQGFALPFDRYFSGDLKDRIDAFLDGSYCSLFDENALRAIGRQYRAGKIFWTRIWTLFMVEDWCSRNGVCL